MAELEADILSSWVNWDADLVTRPELVHALSGGSSHSSFLVSGLSSRGSTDYFVVRVENSHNRQLAMPVHQEVALMRWAKGLAPQVVFQNSLLLVSAYIEAPQWTPPGQLRTIATGLRELHKRPPPAGLADFDLLRHCDVYWTQLGQPQRHHDFYRAWRDQLDEVLRSYPDRCLCHNDLNPGNMLLHDSTLVLLDWEYAAINSPWFDLASLAEFGQLDHRDLQLLSQHYGPDSDLHAIEQFRPVVRLLEWLWLSLQGATELAEHSRQRLLQLQYLQ